MTLRVAAWALFSIAFVVPYWSFTAWWKFVPATGVMLATQRYLQGPRWRRVVGLDLSWRACARAVALFAAVAVAAHFLVHHIAGQAGIARVGPWMNAYRWLPWCQVLNEEMVFRALLLGLCVRLGAPARLVSCAAAVIFVLSHVMIYRFGIGQTWLLPQTAVTLFCFAWLTNEMYLRTGHIAYPIAVHVGWNLTRFGASWDFADVAWQAAEVFGFNTFEAHPVVMLASAAGAVVTMLGTRSALSPSLRSASA